MERKYIGQIHPAVGFFYIAAVLVITMITMNPYLLAISCITSIIVMGYLKGLSELRKNIVPDISVIIFTVDENYDLSRCFQEAERLCCIM